MLNFFSVRHFSQLHNNLNINSSIKEEQNENVLLNKAFPSTHLFSSGFKIQIPSNVDFEIIEQPDGNSVLRFSGQAGSFDLFIHKYFTKSQLFLFKSLNKNDKDVGTFLSLFLGSSQINHKKKIEQFNGIRALIDQICKGVTTGHVEYLELVGTGYRCVVGKEGIELKVGQSHPIIYKLPPGIRAFSTKPTQLGLYGVHLSQITQTAHLIRKLKTPDSYKGKGIRLVHETFSLKSGKKK
jgi:large subunit ribosomal protein L6